ncbi:protein kinase [Streptomyces sp. NPDC101776]|uniref:serine/threonine-protein kinase n=1 Tax=Streptomyces sp. NPDC101776 TaxID=3366146 RepID=UPI003811FF11
MVKPLQYGTDPLRIGPYEVMGRLGSGGMGVVYLARNTGSGCLVAVKTIRADLAKEPGYQERFAREIEVARTVRSLYIAQLVDFAPGPASPWLATALVPGPNLAEVLAKHGPLPAETVRVLALGLAGALTAIHAARIVHRDLKPSNIILSEGGPRLLDFGIARPLGQEGLTATRQFIGTSAYASPEQLLAHRADPPSDVFSLGVVLAEAAGLAMPIDPLAAAIVDGRTPALSSLPPDVRNVIHKCLSQSPEDRPAADELPGMLTTSARPHCEGTRWLPDSVLLLARRTSQELLAVTHPVTALDPRFAGGHQQETATARMPRGATVVPPHATTSLSPPAEKKISGAKAMIGAALFLLIGVAGFSLAGQRSDSGQEATPSATVTVTASGRPDNAKPASPRSSETWQPSPKPARLPSAAPPKSPSFTRGPLGVSRYRDPEYRAAVTSVAAARNQLTVTVSARGRSDLREAETTCLEVQGAEGTFTVLPFAKHARTERPGAFDGTLAFPLLVSGRYTLRYSCQSDYTGVDLGTASVPHMSISRYTDPRYFAVVLSADRTSRGLQLVFASTGPPDLRDPNTSCLNRGTGEEHTKNLELNRSEKTLNFFYYGVMNFPAVGANSTFSYSCSGDYSDASLP